MKILIFAHPRSGSSLLQQILACAYNIKNKTEPFTDYMHDTEKYTSIISSLKETDDYIIKIQSHNIPSLDYTKIDFTIFDKIYVTERKDKTLACISTQWALRTKKWDYKYTDPIVQLTPFNVSQDEVIDFSSTIKTFNTVLSYFNEQKIVYEHITFEDIDVDDVNISVQLICKKVGLETASIKISHRKSLLDYTSYCINYDQVKKWMAEDGF